MVHLGDLAAGSESGRANSSNATLARQYYKEAAGTKLFGQWQIPFQARAFFQLGVDAFTENTGNRSGNLLEAARYLEDAARADSDGPGAALRALAVGARWLAWFRALPSFWQVCGALALDPRTTMLVMHVVGILACALARPTVAVLAQEWARL